MTARPSVIVFDVNETMSDMAAAERAGRQALRGRAPSTRRQPLLR